MLQLKCYNMKGVKNPFLLQGYVAPEYFCDRKEETKNLVSALLNGRNVTLMSPRRMGKSGLIHNAFHHLASSNPEIKCFYLDIYSTRNLREFTLLFGQAVLGAFDSISEKFLTRVNDFIKSCRPVVGIDPLTGKTTFSLNLVGTDAGVTLKEIFEYLKASDVECVIAIDEFQQIAEYDEPGTEALLRSYIQFIPNVHFIFSGSKRHMMEEMFSSPKRPFYKSTQKLPLSEIDFDAYYAFASSHMERNGIILSRDAFQYIYTLVYGHTWYVQRILNSIYATHEGEVTLQDVSQTVENILREEEYNFQRDFKSLTHNQQSLLLAIAMERQVSQVNASAFIHRYDLGATSSINKALKALIDKEFILESQSGYELYDRFMALWLTNLPSLA